MASLAYWLRLVFASTRTPSGLLQVYRLLKRLLLHCRHRVLGLLNLIDTWTTGSQHNLNRELEARTDRSLPMTDGSPYSVISAASTVPYSSSSTPRIQPPTEPEVPIGASIPSPSSPHSSIQVELLLETDPRPFFPEESNRYSRTHTMFVPVKFVELST